jgi:hypothetical protein
MRADSPHVPGRATGWPVRRTPRTIVVAGIVLLALTAAAALVHKPTSAERASDLRSFLQAVNTDIESCAGGVGESLTALHEIDSGSSHDVTDAITVAGTGASNCSPANNMQIDDLEELEVPESLASFDLQNAVTGLVSWATLDAGRVQTDVAGVLAARSPQTREQAETALKRALSRLDAQRSAADAVMESAIRSLAVHAAPPRLPG